LIIPKLEVDQSIVLVSIMDGAWDMSTLDQHVGWLTTTGADPGGDWAITLAGHVNISSGNPGPFLNLKKLAAGDRIVYRSGGLDYITCTPYKVSIRSSPTLSMSYTSPTDSSSFWSPAPIGATFGATMPYA
jgi:hypothetical protein